MDIRHHVTWSQVISSMMLRFVIVQGGKGFGSLSMEQFVESSLLPKKLFCAAMVVCSKWQTSSEVASSFPSAILSATTTTDSSSSLTAELTRSISLSASLLLMFLPQHIRETIGNDRLLNSCCSFLHSLKAASHLRKSMLVSFYHYKYMWFTDQSSLSSSCRPRL